MSDAETELSPHQLFNTVVVQQHMDGYRACPGLCHGCATPTGLGTTYISTDRTNVLKNDLATRPTAYFRRTKRKKKATKNKNKTKT